MKRDTSNAECRASVAAMLMLSRELNEALLLSKTDAVWKWQSKNVAEAPHSSKTVGCLYFVCQLPSMTFPIIAETETLDVAESIINKELPGMAAHQSSFAKSL